MQTTNPFAEELIATAKAIARPGHGILAADESPGTIGKRFDALNIENTFETRETFRGLLFTTPNLSDYISGAILHDEATEQKTEDGISFIKVLES